MRRFLEISTPEGGAERWRERERERGRLIVLHRKWSGQIGLVRGLTLQVGLEKVV